MVSGSAKTTASALRRIKIWLCQSVRYVFTAAVILYVYVNTHVFDCMFLSGVELLAFYFLAELVRLKQNVLGNIIGAIGCLILNVQSFVLLFGNSYVTVVMLNNLASIKDLSGKAVPILTATVLTLVCSFWPGLKRYRVVSRNRALLLLGGTVLCLAANITLIFRWGYYVSPSASAVYAVRQYIQMEQQKAQIIKNLDADRQAFYRETISQYREKDAQLPETPNVILIFTEGFSANVIDDEQEITPNIAAFREKSLSFTGYYNHTFATYHGLIGQLYSGYQLDNLDENYLISLQSIFADNGYATAFINTEPNNEDFSTYLASFGFQQLLSGETCSGMVNSMSDAEAYDFLYETAVELSEGDSPFFLSMYTFGTHATLDSVDIQFGDGSKAFLNKFYSMDAAFGTFFERFSESTLADNTLLILTADHASYSDADFTAAFPDYTRAYDMIDEIPLMFYYKGIEPEEIEVSGRNTLDLAPTLLDYLDISAPNYFLGDSLFTDQSASVYDTISCVDMSVWTSEGGTLTSSVDNAEELLHDIHSYMSVSRQEWES